MTRDDARLLVVAELAKNGARYGKQFAVLEHATLEEDFGWVFFYNSKQFVETRDPRWALGGNAPLIVDRHTGVVHVTGTAHPIEHYILEYRRTRSERT